MLWIISHLDVFKILEVNFYGNFNSLRSGVFKCVKLFPNVNYQFSSLSQNTFSQQTIWSPFPHKCVYKGTLGVKIFIYVQLYIWTHSSLTTWWFEALAQTLRWTCAAKLDLHWCRFRLWRWRPHQELWCSPSGPTGQPRTASQLCTCSKYYFITREHQWVT